jgi:hypothetical protein
MNAADRARALRELEILQRAFDRKVGRQSIPTGQYLFSSIGDPPGSTEDLKTWQEGIQRVSDRLRGLTSRLPTPYDDPYSFAILEGNWKLISDVIPDNDPHRSDLERVQLGTIATGDVNASVVPVPQSDALLLLFHSSIALFVHLLLKPAARILFLAGRFEYAGKPRTEILRWVAGAVQAHQAGSLDRFRECLTATVVLGKPGFASPYGGEASAAYADTMDHVLAATESFIVAHEIGHLFRGHLVEKEKMKVVLEDGTVPFAYYFNWMMEFEADLTGTEICSGVMSGVLREPSAFLYLGPFLFFACAGVLERCIAVLATGEDVAQPSRWKPPAPGSSAGSSHPPSWMRAERLLKSIRKAEHLAALDEFEFARDCYVATMDLLWQMSESYFIDLYHEGVRPAARWQMIANRFSSKPPEVAAKNTGQ